MVEFWECFITVGLGVAEICREVGITPAGFFNLQTKDEYSAYQTEFSQQVVGFYMSYKKLETGFLGKLEHHKSGFVACNAVTGLAFDMEGRVGEK